MLQLLWLIPAIPFAGALVLSVFGPRIACEGRGCGWSRQHCRVGRHFAADRRCVPDRAAGGQGSYTDALDLDRCRRLSIRRLRFTWTPFRW